MRGSRNLFVVALVLYILGSFVLYLGQKQNTSRENADSFTELLNNKLDGLEIEFSVAIEKLSSPDLLTTNFSKYGGTHAYYIYNNDKLIHWTRNQIVPHINSVRPDKSVQYFEKAGWKGVIKQWSSISNSGDSRLIVFIPIVYTPPIVNEFLTPWFNENLLQTVDFKVVGNGELDESNTERFVFINDGEDLFKFRFGSAYKDLKIWNQIVGTVLLTLSLLLTIFISHKRCLKEITSRKFIFASIRFIALSILLFGTAFGIKSMALVDNLYVFDSKIYASSFILNSLYSLIIFNVIILEFSILLVTFLVQKRQLQWFVRKKGIVISTLGIVGLYMVFSLQHMFLRGLYDSSQATLDIYHSLAITPMRMISISLLIINSATIYFLFNGFYRIWLLSTESNISRVTSFIVATGIFLLMQNEFPYLVIITLLLLFLVSVYFSKNHRHYLKSNYASLLYIVSFLIVSSMLASYSIYTIEKAQTTENLKAYGQQNLIDEDIFAEYLINDAVIEIYDDPFISYWMTSPFVSKSIIGRKIRQEYLGRYLEKYNVQIFLFNQEGNNINESAGTPGYHTIKNRFATLQNGTDFENVYQVNRLRSDFYKRYLAFIEVKRYDNVIGYVVLDLNQKRSFKPSVYPELLVDMRLVVPFSDMNISYALYNSRELISAGGEYNYVTGFDSDFINDPKIFEDGIVKNDYLHVGIPTDNKVLIVSTKGYDPLEVFSNFSFLFLVMVLLLGIMLLIISWFRVFQRPITGFAVRIQLFMNLAFIIPLLLVSFTTVSLLNSTSESNIQSEYLAKARALSERIQQPLDNFLVSPSSRDDLVDIMRQTASTLDTDADLFNLAGGLIASTHPEIYDKGLLSRYIDPSAYDLIVKQSTSNYTATNTVGKLVYSATYIPIKTSDTGKFVGILSLPFFDYKDTLELQQIEVLSNILNIFSLLFIVLLFLSYLVSQRLVYPLNIISDKLNKMSFSGYNEPIEWNSKDEIGRLVGEYNTMISNLAESRAALARTEREVAWREIAQHVAHEIKNPLTPMKLTLQQLQRRLASEENKENEWIGKPVETLLHQIDVLRDIASSFSAFAKMPIPDIKEFDLGELLLREVELHKNEVTITTDNLDSGQIVLGDEKLMGRIITNIILNAKQSGGNGTIVHIAISDSGNHVISIADNGPGIDDDIKDKIFLPGFSTKKTGSGIGLAMAKHGVEQSGGQIWFETGSQGTTFFIELPGIKR